MVYFALVADDQDSLDCDGYLVGFFTESHRDDFVRMMGEDSDQVAIATAVENAKAIVDDCGTENIEFRANMHGHWVAR